VKRSDGQANSKFPAVEEIRYLGRFLFFTLRTQLIRFVIISATERWLFHRFITFSSAARGQKNRPPLTRPLRIPFPADISVGLSRI
jgi:hypothetical protein